MAFRHAHPNIPIYLSKSDYKAAYRRIHQALKLAIQCGLILNKDIIILLVRLSFGGASNPSIWSDIAEMACDLINELLCSRDWEPKEFVPFLPIEMPEPKPLLSHIPLAPGFALSVDVAANEFGICEVFIDDKFLAIPAMHDNVERARYTLAIVIALLE